MQECLSSADPRVRADAANALARLRAKDGNDQLRKLLATDPDPIVRANAARVLGATTDKEAFEALVKVAKEDQDSRVRVSAIRSLASLKDQEPRVANALASMPCERILLTSGKMLYQQTGAACLDLVTALGRVFQGTDNREIFERIDKWQGDFVSPPPEVELAKLRIAPSDYLAILGNEPGAKRNVQRLMWLNWREASAVAQALGEVVALPDSTKDHKDLIARAEALLRSMLNYQRPDSKDTSNSDSKASLALPDVLRAFAAFKSNDLDAMLVKHIAASDVGVRSTAADLLADRTSSEENTRALAAALPKALVERDNDAALSIIDALGKKKNPKANDAVKLALDSRDHLVRRRAVATLKTSSEGDFSARIGIVQATNTFADYQRALARIGKTVRATIKTDKGSFIIDLLPEEAPLTVDNFVLLSKRGYFNDVTFHRVVPNFVIQGGDPRGDGNGGPGYSIRCEINHVPYERGTVGMALSGKDTGGSQWFVTHSPQPHLDGGYTVFGRVTKGLDVVDKITRGDLIRSIVISEARNQNHKRYGQNRRPHRIVT